MMLNFLLGVVIAAMIFATFLWSLSRAVLEKGHMRIVFAASCLAIIAGMFAINLDAMGPGRLAGAGCSALAVYAIYHTPGWARVFVLIQALFGFALAAGLPWSAP